VGPQSAAGDPGPACYGRGGTDPTVTDADLVLGFLNPAFFLGGKLELDVDAAEGALQRLADGLGLALIEAAAGVHRVVNENMANAARMHAIERGRDLRRFTLVATGGAGPVHAWGVASALGIRRILFPPNAGVASAFGMLTAQPAFDFVRSLPGALAGTDWDTVRTLIADMRAEGGRQLRGVGVGEEKLEVQLSADLRHRGQGETLVVSLGAGLSAEPATQVEAAFEDRYVTLYGRRPPGVPLEVLAWRLRVSGPRPEVGLGEGGAGAPSALKGRRKVWFPDQNDRIEVDVLDRYAVAPGDVLPGPAIFEEVESTAVVGPGASIRVIDGGSLEVTIDD
jgi:N-methylhydantoinase A/oxoprolinase/acetone carboxylase beta subunit